MTIQNEFGIHARSASMIVRIAEQSRSRITIERDGVEVDARSLLDILTLGCPKGTRIIVRAEGEDAEAVMERLQALVESKFGESA